MEWATIKEMKLRDTISTLLTNLNKMEDETPNDLIIAIQSLLMCNPNIASSMFDVLLYYLEREEEIARKNIIHAIHVIVVKQHAINPFSLFTKMVKDNITYISHGCDRQSNKVRLYLHKCIKYWIDHQIVSRQFLLDLQKKEQQWTFSKPTPYFVISQNEAPKIFDMAMLGIVGRGKDSTYMDSTSMQTLVKNGTKEGIQEGWLYIDENGHHKINIEKALEMN